MKVNLDSFLRRQMFSLKRKLESLEKENDELKLALKNRDDELRHRDNEFREFHERLAKLEKKEEAEKLVNEIIILTILVIIHNNFRFLFIGIIGGW